MILHHDFVITEVLSLLRARGMAILTNEMLGYFHGISGGDVIQ